MNSVDPRILKLKNLAVWMDTKFKIPFLNIRTGLDSLIGLIPGIGDIVSFLISLYIILHSYHYSRSFTLLIRMLANSLIDFIFGLIPIFGDIADIFYKANIKNIALAEKHFKKHPLIILLIFFAFSCSAPPKTYSKPFVVSTTTLAKNLVDTLWKDSVESASLMGPGIDPHLYQATAQDLKKLIEADLIIAHGLHLEGKMVDAIESLSKRKKVLIIGEHLDHQNLIQSDNNMIDPHTWFDPELWIQSADILIKHSGLPPPNKNSIINFKSEIKNLSEKYKMAFKQIPIEQRTLITSHDAFRYLGRYFQIEVEGIQGVSTDAEVGVKRIENLLKTIKAKKIKSIFIESSVSPRSIEKILSESSTKLGGLLYSDALGDSLSGADTYVKMLEYNLETILKGLKP